MSGKVPPSSRAKRRKPIHPSPDVRRAASLYERFSGHEAEAVGRLKIPSLPRVAAAIGYVDGIMYSTVRDDVAEKYIHKFAAKDRPILAVTPNGKQILLVGGHYSFTELGIVDNSDVKTRERMRRR